MEIAKFGRKNERQRGLHVRHWKWKHQTAWAMFAPPEPIVAIKRNTNLIGNPSKRKAKITS
jgi:hypothetical protein